MDFFAGVEWQKSSFSGGSGDGEGCVEVAFLRDGNIALRDSKDRSLLPHVFSPLVWECFVAGVRAGELDHPQV